MTKAALTRQSIALHGVPVALLLAPLTIAPFLPNLYQLAIPLVALGVGIMTRPRSVPIVWAALYVAMFVVAVAALAFGRELPKMPDDNQGLAPSNLIFIALLLCLYLEAVVAPPLWIGRWLGKTLTHDRQRRTSPA